MESKIENVSELESSKKNIHLSEDSYLKLEQMAYSRKVSADELCEEMLKEVFCEAETDPLNYLSRFGKKDLRKLIFK